MTEHNPTLLDISQLPEEFLSQLPPKVREFFKQVTFDIRVDLDSVLAKPFEASFLEQMAFAACSPAEAARTVFEAASLAHDRIYRRLERSGQERMLRWVLQGYIPSGVVPIEIALNLAGYLSPGEVDE